MKKKKSHNQDKHLKFCINGHEYRLWGRTETRACRGCLKHKQLLRCYGITLDEYMAIYKAQGGKCAICKIRLAEPWNKAKEGWQPNDPIVRAELDHNHAKKGRESVRGLLCGGRWKGCNRKLGMVEFFFKNNSANMLRLMAYYLETGSEAVAKATTLAEITDQKKIA